MKFNTIQEDASFHLLDKMYLIRCSRLPGGLREYLATHGQFWILNGKHAKFL